MPELAFTSFLVLISVAHDRIMRLRRVALHFGRGAISNLYHASQMLGDERGWNDLDVVPG